MTIDVQAVLDAAIDHRKTAGDALNRAARLHEQLAAAQNALRSLGQAYADLKTDNDDLAAENARLRQDRDTQADIAQNRADVITNLTEVIERVEQRANAHTAVVEAAKELVKPFPTTLAATFGALGEAMVAAVDALPKAGVAS